MKSKIITVMKNIELPLFYFNGKFNMKNFKSFPFASYSNGVPCVPVNMYLQSKEIIKLGEATIYKKGYALSNFISFCESNNKEFKDFSESDLYRFAESLKNELNAKDPTKKARKNNTTNYILKETLYFLNYFGRKFLGQEDYSITILNAEEKSVNIKISETGKTIQSSGVYHRCFAPYDSLKRRSPISQKNIDSLYETIPLLSDCKHIQYRTNVMLKLLDITGARAGEIAELKVDDIEEAYNQENPLLKMVTLKRRGQHEIRYVPVEKLDLKDIRTFIKIYRSKIIRKTIGKPNDHGYLFINQKTGKKLIKSTISKEINDLKKLAGIKGQTCAHMFRHRYITNFFIKLIKQYDLENKDDFRNALLDVNSLKVHIQQATGHKNANSLDHYIDLAKAELTNIDKVIDKVNDTKKVEAIEREEKLLLNMLQNRNITIEEYSEKLRQLKQY